MAVGKLVLVLKKAAPTMSGVVGYDLIFTLLALWSLEADHPPSNKSQKVLLFLTLSLTRFSYLKFSHLPFAFFFLTSVTYLHFYSVADGVAV